MLDAVSYCIFSKFLALFTTFWVFSKQCISELIPRTIRMDRSWDHFFLIGLNLVHLVILNLFVCFSGTVDHAVSDSSTLAFWMANSSELLHFLKSDRHITAFSLRAQDILAETVHNAFKFLVEFFQAELEMCMPGILSESEDDDQATQGIMKVYII